jgi:F-type H+-transporting ATPase subunit b
MTMRPLYFILAATGHKPPPLVDIDGTIFIQLGIFLFLLIVLTRFVFRPYLALRTDRSKNIEGAREEAGRLNQDALEKISAHEEQLSKTRKETAATRAQIRQEGEVQATDLLSHARQSADTKVEAARAEIEKSSQAARLALRTRADQIARVVATKILGREV